MRKRWKLFADAYLGLIKHDTSTTWNATESAKVAGYSGRTAYSIGSRLLKNVKVDAYIQAQLTAMQMGPEETKSRLAEQARGEYAKYLVSDGTVNLESMLADGKGHLIKKIKRGNWSRTSPEGVETTRESMEVEFVDGQNALIYIGKHHKLFTDKTELDISDQMTAKLEKFAKVIGKVYGSTGGTGDLPKSGA